MPEAYAQMLDRSKIPAQFHIMNWYPDIKSYCNLIYYKIKKN